MKFTKKYDNTINQLEHNETVIKSKYENENNGY